MPITQPGKEIVHTEMPHKLNVIHVSKRMPCLKTKSLSVFLYLEFIARKIGSHN